jgi:hypothetical protein
MDEKETTVYKRALDMEYKLRLKASRAIFSEINKKAPALPFTTRALVQVRRCRCQRRALPCPGVPMPHAGQGWCGVPWAAEQLP